MDDVSEPHSDIHPAPLSPLPNPVDTRLNQFNVFRRYAQKPQRDLEDGLSFEDFADAASHARPPQKSGERNPLRPFGSTVASMLHHAKDAAASSYAPFLNWSAFKLMQWQYTGSMTKSSGELQRLVDVLTHPEFKTKDLVGFNVEQEKCRLDEFGATGGAFSAEDGWREASVTLCLPKEKSTHTSEAQSPKFTVKNIWVRCLTEVLKAGYCDGIAQRFHWLPFHFFHHARQGPDMQSKTRLYTDIYNSDAMIQEDEVIQKRARDTRDPSDGPDVEYVVGAIGVYSDSTHLTSFGTASLWPIYAFFTNLSKYLHSKPTMFAAHHLAYIPSVRDYTCSTIYTTNARPIGPQLPVTLSHAYEEKFGEPPSAAVLRLLKHDLMQKIWLLLLDDEFMDAYTHGIKLICSDGVIRRIFPRIFTYSADYPEKYIY